MELPDPSFADAFNCYKVCALLSTTPAEICLTVVPMLYGVIWVEIGQVCFVCYCRILPDVF